MSPLRVYLCFFILIETMFARLVALLALTLFVKLVCAQDFTVYSMFVFHLFSTGLLEGY